MSDNVVLRHYSTGGYFVVENIQKLTMQQFLIDNKIS